MTQNSHSRIDRKVEKDRYDNEVSLIHLPGPRPPFRMVHHKTKSPLRDRATIYAGKGKFVTMRAFSPTNDCVATSIEVAGYTMYWGDGDPLDPTCNPAGPNLHDRLRAIHDDNFEAVIILVLDAIKDIDAMWERKEVRAAA